MNIGNISNMIKVVIVVDICTDEDGTPAYRCVRKVYLLGIKIYQYTYISYDTAELTEVVNSSVKNKMGYINFTENLLKIDDE